MEDSGKQSVSSKEAVEEDKGLNYEDDLEDLPENFFDDFSNQDFMDGLNVVDDWNDEDDSNESKPVEKIEKVVKKSEPRKRREKSPKSKKENARSSKNRIKQDVKRRSRSKNRYPRTSEHQEKHEALIDHRRDPEKTKRDIQRDKLRCAKDHDAKVFQEQLKIAETGLVPPGTELDVVLNSDKFKENEEPIKEKPKDKSKERKEKINDRKDDSTRKKTSRSHSKSRRRRPHLRSISREKSFSPKRRKRSSYSRERELRYRDIPETDLRYRIREKRERHDHSKRRRFTRSPSPYESPKSAISERETWLRNREHSKRRSRSMSPINTSRIRSSSPKKKKFSFMEEIEIKLRQKPIRDINAFNIQPQTIPNLMASPVPPPDYFPPSMQFPTQQPMYLAPPTMCPAPDQFQPPILISSEQNIIPMPNILYSNPQPMFLHGIGPYNPPEPVPAPLFIDHNQMQNQFRNQSLQVNVGNNENQDMAKVIGFIFIVFMI